MQHPKAGFGAKYVPDNDHYHDQLHDADIVEQLSSPTHGIQGVTDEKGDDRNRNNFYLQDRESRGADGARPADSPNADKRHRPKVTSDPGAPGNKKAGQK